MRLFVLPVSTRQALVYCQRHQVQATAAKPPLSERIIQRASKTWIDWEKKEKGWQKKVTDYGNQLLQRLPYQEFGLKGIPALTKGESARLEQLKKGTKAEEVPLKDSASSENGGAAVVKTIRVEFPAGLIEESRVLEELERLGNDTTQSFHRKWLGGSLLAMPLSAPFAAIPM